MANWYGIEGIEFHFNGNTADPTITFEGITDDACIDVEGTMWERFEDEPILAGIGEYQAFGDYMRDNADEVEYLIRLARGQVEV